jgi:phytoene dehydrogenase-like protein
MHADIPADAPGSGMFGWLMAMLGQDVGFPVPEGGAGALADALTRAVIAAGGQVRTSAPVEEILVSGGAATGVRLAGGARIGARRAVVADVGAHQLYRELLPGAVVPPRLQADLDRFDWDLPTVKVNWSLKGRVPWRAAGLDRTACVHLGADADELVRWSADLGSGRVPERPFMLLGQMAVADASRAPAGGDSVWAYSHLPRAGTRHRAGDRAGDSAGDRETLAAQAKELAARMTAVVEAHAPGFTGQIADVLVQAPGDLAGADANLVHGTINGGTAQLHQQLVFRPVPGLGRPETVVPGLYLASAAGHPGGGVHGGAGAMAARVALRDARWRRLPGRALSAASRTLYAPARRPWPGD